MGCFASPLLAALAALLLHAADAQRFDGQYWPCNPIKNATGSCTPNIGLDTYMYSIDFTNPPSDMSDYWSGAVDETVTYNTLAHNGAEFTFAKRYDSPQLYTNFYILFGHVDVVMQVAPGTGIISSSVLLSDDFDEIDWEFSGNNFNMAQYYSSGNVPAQYQHGMGQNNYFGKGITGSYDRGQWQNITNPQTTFHTYSVDWNPTRLQWLVDGQVVRTLVAANCDNNTHQYPQTPSKIQIGMWDGGDPGENYGTLSWAGGTTNLTGGQYTMFLKSVSVTNYNPAKYYNYTDQSGTWQSIKKLNTSLPASYSTTTTAASTSTAILPLMTNLPISPNGHCGANVSTICAGSLFGNCCSAYGYCGNTTEYCGLGCQTAYGTCGTGGPAGNVSTTGIVTTISSSVTIVNASGVATSSGSNATRVASGNGTTSTTTVHSTGTAQITIPGTSGQPLPTNATISSGISASAGNATKQNTASSSTSAANSTTAMSSTASSSASSKNSSTSSYVLSSTSTTSSATAAYTTPVCWGYNQQNYLDDNGKWYYVYCSYMNTGNVIATNTSTLNLKQCMDACDEKPGCVTANFQTGANVCYLLSTNGTHTPNNVYNVGYALSPPASSSSAKSPASTAGASNVRIVAGSTSTSQPPAPTSTAHMTTSTVKSSTAPSSSSTAKPTSSGFGLFDWAWPGNRYHFDSNNRASRARKRGAPQQGDDENA
jgi:beta-glucanase (GH16 family)